MRNRVTLDAIPRMPIGEIAALPTGQLALLTDEAAEALEHARRVKEWLDGALDLKYGAHACAARAVGGKTTGTVRLQDSVSVVAADLPTRAKWDQARLAAAIDTIRRDWHDEPAQYIRTELKFSETAYGSWPQAIRQLFEPARTIETRKPTYRIEHVQREVA